MTLKIAYPSIFTQGVEERVLNGTERFGTDWIDAFNGERSARGYIQADGSGYAFFSVDLGLGTLGTVDHIILSHVGGYTGVSEVGIAYGNVSISSGWDDSFAASSPTSLSKVGPRSEDYIYFPGYTANARYWVAYFYATASLNIRLGKIYAGVGLDLGREPIFEIERVPTFRSDIKMTGGGYERSISTEYVYRFKFQWERVSDTNTQTFIDKVMDRAVRDRFFLYTTANHQILNDERLVHVRLVEAKTDNSSRKANYNTVYAEFEELVG